MEKSKPALGTPASSQAPWIWHLAGISTSSLKHGNSPAALSVLSWTKPGQNLDKTRTKANSRSPVQHEGIHAGAGWGTTPVFSRGNVFPPAGNGADTVILRSSRWDSRAGSQIQALPAFQQVELLGRSSGSKAEVGRIKVPTTCLPWLLQPSRTTNTLPLLTDLANWQILRGNRAASLEQSPVPSPASAAVRSPKHQQHSDPKVKLAIRDSAERAGQALPSASDNSTDVQKPWAGLCQLRANASYFAFFMHFCLSLPALLPALPAAAQAGGQNCQPALGQSCWDDPGMDELGHSNCSKLSGWMFPGFPLEQLLDALHLLWVDFRITEWLFWKGT